jgi:hypothetical protein
MDRGSSTTGGHLGGQTGSLVPCSTPPQFSADGAVPEGDAAFVFHSGCASEEAFSVLDENGVPVSFQLEELDNGVVLVRTDTALTAGSYTVVAPDGNVRTVTVEASAPLPSNLGELSRPADSCSNLVLLTLSSEVLPYVPLLRLEFSMDGSPFAVWFEYATVPQSSTPLRLALNDLQPGTHEVRVASYIAGETIGSEPASLTFTSECQPALVDNGGCSLGKRGPWSRVPGLAAALSLLFFATGVGWRRRRRPVS